MKKYSILLIICIIINLAFAVGYRTLAYHPALETAIQAPHAFDDMTLNIYEPNPIALKTNLYQYNGKSIEVDYDNGDFDPLSNVFSEQTQNKKYYRPFTKLHPPYNSFSSKDYFAFIHDEYNQVNAPKSFLIVYDLKQGGTPKKIRLDSVVQSEPNDNFSTNKIFQYENFIYIPFEIHKYNNVSTPERKFGIFRYNLTKGELEIMNLPFDPKKVEDLDSPSDFYDCIKIDDTIIVYDLSSMHIYHLSTQQWTQKDITNKNPDPKKILSTRFISTQHKESLFVKLIGQQQNIKDITKLSITPVDSNFKFGKEKTFDLAKITGYIIRDCIYSNNKLYITLDCYEQGPIYNETPENYIGFLIYDLQSSKVLYEGYMKNHGYNLTPRFVPTNK